MYGVDHRQGGGDITAETQGSAQWSDDDSPVPVEHRHQGELDPAQPSRLGQAGYQRLAGGLTPTEPVHDAVELGQTGFAPSSMLSKTSASIISPASRRRSPILP